MRWIHILNVYQVFWNFWESCLRYMEIQFLRNHLFSCSLTQNLSLFLCALCLSFPHIHTLIGAWCIKHTHTRAYIHTIGTIREDAWVAHCCNYHNRVTGTKCQCPKIFLYGNFLYSSMLIMKKKNLLWCSVCFMSWASLVYAWL